MYAVIGMNLFGDVTKGENIDEHTNFRSFLSGLITLFRMSTGENWNGIMYDCMEESNCTGQNCVSHPFVVIVYFVSFVIFSSFLMLNVFVAVVLKNFEEEVMSDPKNSTSPVNRDAIIHFGEKWADYCESEFLVFRTPGWSHMR